MNDERPILEVRQSAWNMSSTTRSATTDLRGPCRARSSTGLGRSSNHSHYSLADIDYISVKRYLQVWSDLLIVPKNGAAIRLRPLGESEAAHVETLIQRQAKKMES